MAQFESSDFQRAFAAMRYLAGRRDAELLEPFRFPHPDARAFARGLAHPERDRRAEALARELARVANALETRSFK
ncbi:MAG TPA: hypothetical protein VJV79_03210 [Polyangiaceae bacterium]|nr:hypothetical protein [Polyangiaceae bacterium]